MGFWSNFFKSSQNTSESSRSYNSFEQENNYHDSYFSGSFDDNQDDEGDCEDDPYYEIVFWKELSNGTLIFQIVDDDFDPAGHVLVTKCGATEILEGGFHDFDDDDRQHLRKRVKKFCDLAEIGKS